VVVQGVELELDLAGPAGGGASGQDAAAAAPGAGALPVLPFHTARVEDARVRATTPLGAVALVGSAEYADERLALRAELPPLGLAGGRLLAAPFEAAQAEILVPALRLGGELRRAGERLDFDLRATGLDERFALGAAGSVDPGGRAAEATLRLEPLVFARGGLQPRTLAPALSAWLRGVEGALEARGQATLRGGELAAQLDLVLRDLVFETPLARFEGVNGALRLESLRPPSSPPHQLLSLGRVDFGLELSDGLVRYRLLPDPALDLELAEWRFAGGRVHTAGRLDPAAPEQRLVLELEDLELERLLALLPLAGLSGEGRLSGRLPLVRRGDSLEIRGGVLRGAEAGGWLRYRPAGVGPATGERAANVRVLLTALENLRWESLEARIDGDARGEVTLALHVAGRDPERPERRPVELNVTVESRLADLLQKASASYRIPAQVERRIGEILGERAGAGALAPDAGAR
jgi:hypothetical protein